MWKKDDMYRNSIDINLVQLAESRGMASLELVWEREVVSVTLYVLQNTDPLMQAVAKGQYLPCGAAGVTT